MTIAHLLEDFGGLDQLPALSGIAEAVPADLLETERLEAYEEGYKAGWDDAVGANTAEQLQLSTDLAQNLKDLSFTYEEAVTHVTQACRGVFDGMLSHFLPQVATEALAPKVVEIISALPLQSEKMDLVLMAAEDNVKIMEKVVAHIEHVAIAIEADPDLTAGQVTLRFRDQEVALDFDALLGELRIALEAALPAARNEE